MVVLKTKSRPKGRFPSKSHLNFRKYRNLAFVHAHDYSCERLPRRLLVQTIKSHIFTVIASYSMAAIIGPMRPYDNNLTFAITSLTVVDLGHLHMRERCKYIGFNRECASQGETQGFCESDTPL